MSIRTNHSVYTLPILQEKNSKNRKNVFFALFFENLPKTKLNNLFIETRAIGENVGASKKKSAITISTKIEFFEVPRYM